MDIYNQSPLLEEVSPNTACVRCKIAVADFICDECSFNTLYCSKCDGYLHSLPTKRHHIRRLFKSHHQINPSLSPSSSSHYQPLPSPKHIIQEQSYQPYHHPNDNTTITQTYVNEIKNIYEAEKTDLIAKNNQLNKQLHQTTVTLNERIDFLHSHLEQMKKEHNSQISHMNNTQVIKSQGIEQEKDEMISFLNEKINRLEGIIAEQSKKIEGYEANCDQDKRNYDDYIAIAKCDLEEAIRENANMKEYYEMRIAELTQLTGLDKNKIVNNYEDTIAQLKEGYLASKEKYLTVIQQREDDMKEMLISHRKETIELNSIIDKLKENYHYAVKDRDEVMVLNDNLKAGLQKAKEDIEKLQKDNSQFSLENTMINKAIEEIQVEYNELSEKHDKASRIAYGKFTQPKKTIKPHKH